jgi:hypothetical protein
MYNETQLKLFKTRGINPTYEIKRQIRLVLSTSTLSRDQISDRMNDISAKESMSGQKITKDKLDGWCKDSDPARLPSLVELVLFCASTGNNNPLAVLADSLGCEIVGHEEKKVLAWGKAEIEKRKATKKARLALEEIN